MLDDGVDLNCVRLLVYWYTNQQACVRWHNTVFSKFPINNGTKQGGVLSPYLFTRYVRNLLTSVAECNIGCRVGGVFTIIFSYADDMILLAPSWSAMQQIFELLEKNCITYSILCNTIKTVCMVLT